MTLYDFLECVIHRLTNDVEWINIIDYKKGVQFPIIRNENIRSWEYTTEIVSKYKILHIISEQVTNEYSTILNIIVEEIQGLEK